MSPSQLTHTLVAALIILVWPAALAAQDAKSKPAVPDAAARKEASATIADVYEKEFQQATKTDQKRALAQKMIEDGVKTKDNPAIRHELLRIARDTAIGIGDANLAMQSVESTASSFDVDGLRMKASTLHKLSQRNRSKAVHQELAQHFDAVIADAVAQDRFDIATPLAAIALASAKRTGKRSIVKTAAQRPKEIKELAESYEKVETALATLKTNLSDAKANGVVGQYYCFTKGEWKEGLPFLASGDDPQLKALVEQEGEKSSEPLALGDGWWKVAEGLDGRGKLNVQQRAAGHYRRALLKLEGFAKTRVEKRLASIVPEKNEKTIVSKWQSLARVKPVSTNANVRLEYIAFSSVTDVSKHRLLKTIKHFKLGREWIFLHPNREGSAEIVYDFKKPVKAFQCRLHVAHPKGNIRFMVVADGKEVVNNTKNGADSPQEISLELDGVHRIVLKVHKYKSFKDSWGLFMEPQIRF